MKLKYIAIFFSVIIILNFIPVKFTRIENYQNISKDEYIYSIANKTDNNQYFAVSYGDGKNKVYFNEISGKNPLKALSNDITYNNKVRENIYIFKGKVKNNTFVISDWDIIYPISRKSNIKKLVCPQSFLNVYDFNWKIIIKNWCCKKSYESTGGR